MLTEPRPALAEQSSFHQALVGLAGVGALVSALASDATPPRRPGVEPDNFVYLLLGMASLAEMIDQLGRPEQTPQSPKRSADPPSSTHGQTWLR
ncbi:MAG TPA: hypothetical protein VGH89_28730 [Pseudonocardia sp.]|jgi:hypothetical protein